MGYFMVGSSVVIAIYRGRDLVWQWTPAALNPGFWAGGFDPQS